jgi:hypothetical protein
MTKLYGLRVGSGVSCTSRLFITRPRSVLPVSTTGASPDTVTVSSTPPVTKGRSTVEVCPAATVTPLWDIPLEAHSFSSYAVRPWRKKLKTIKCRSRYF